MTPLGWAELLRVEDWDPDSKPRIPIIPSFSDWYERSCSDLGDLHAIAAEVLYGQPFGFTWEDVDLIRSWTAGLMSKSYGGPGGPEAQRLDSLADRIAALLPPRP